MDDDLFEYPACIHFGALPVDPADWRPSDLHSSDLPAPMMTDHCSFREWSEPVADGDHDGDPILIEAYVTIPLLTVEQVRTGKPGRTALADYVEPMFETLALALPRGWRPVDFAVVTDQMDHSMNVEWVGRWGA